MRPNPQRLAWTILTVAFVVCCGLTGGVPFLGWNFLRNSEVEQLVDLDIGAGTVSVMRPGRLLAEVMVDRLDNVPEGTQIQTERDSQATLSFVSEQDGAALGSMQVYGGTTIILDRIRSPQFAYSLNPHRMLLDIPAGRARVSVEDGGQRSVVITLSTPQGEVVLNRPGSYTIEVNELETQVTVRSGQATARANGGQSIIESNQRTVIPAGEAPLGALPPERNLLAASSFDGAVGTIWNIDERQHAANDDQGTVAYTDELGRPAAHFVRDGFDWGLLQLRQELNRDVRDLRELRLHLAVMIERQDLARCGTMGSECPVMAKIEFVDTSGTSQEWLQGFYTESGAAGEAPGSCVTCPPPTGPHIRLQSGVWYVYDSPNLIEEMKAQGFVPASVRAVTVYASGHVFESQVSEVELLALE